MSVLAAWNELPHADAEADILSCCGSRRWAAGVSAQRPYAGAEQLIGAAKEVWWGLEEQDWMEAFLCHPRIGEMKISESTAARSATGKSVAWSGEEQSGAADAEEAVKQAIAAGNLEYERQYGFLYIVCATGKTQQQMLEILRGRLGRERAAELREAALQQQLITEIRLRKWMGA